MPAVNMNLDTKYPARLVYDTANGICGMDEDHSSSIPAPTLIQIEPLPAGTTVQVQQRISINASWVNAGDPISSGPAIVAFIGTPNFVQLVRTGTGDVLAFAQFSR